MRAMHKGRGSIREGVLFTTLKCKETSYIQHGTEVRRAVRFSSPLLVPFTPLFAGPSQRPEP